MSESSRILDKMRLPLSSPKEALETISRNHLHPLFDPKRFIVRSEDYRDKGVDFQIEVLEDYGGSSACTNFRFVIQLKATDTIQANSDGSFSLQIETANINYLLNHPMPAFYVFFHNPTGKFYYRGLRELASELSKKGQDWNDQASHAIRFSSLLDDHALDQMHRQTMQRGAMNRQLSIHQLMADHSPNPEDKIVIDRNLEMVADHEIRNLIEKGGFMLIRDNRWADILKLHKKASGSLEASGLYNLVLGSANYYSGNMPTALTFLKAAKKKEDTLPPGLRGHISYFEAATKHALGILSEEQYAEQVKSCSDDSMLRIHVSLASAKKEYLENSTVQGAFQKFEAQIQNLISDPSAPRTFQLSAGLELLQIGGENINMSYITNICQINAFGLGSPQLLHYASNYLIFFDHAYSKWMQDIMDIKVKSKEISNQFLYRLACITQIRMNYHLLVISREIFLVEDSPVLPKIEFCEGDHPFRAMLDELKPAIDYFTAIAHIENLTVCLSLEYEIAHYLDDAPACQKAMERMEELVDAHELNVIDVALKRIKANGPYHETFLKSFPLEKHALQKQVHFQRKELQSMDREELAVDKSSLKGYDTIKLHPIGTFCFPKDKRDILYDVLNVTPKARETFDGLFSQSIQPVADIHYTSVDQEGHVDISHKSMTPEAWQNVYLIRKKLYEKKFYRFDG